MSRAEHRQTVSKPLQRSWLVWLAQLTLALLFLLPTLWMLSASVWPPGSALPRRLSLPPGLSVENYLRIWSLLPLWRYTLNSLLVCGLGVPLAVLVASWAGFAIAQLPRGLQRRLLLISVAALLVPGITLWIPRFLIYRQLGLLQGWLPLLAPALLGGSPFFVLIYYRAFRDIPRAIYDAALLDGADAFRCWAFVALPLVRPASVGVSLLNFALFWGDFLSPILYIRSQRLATLPVALSLIGQLGRSEWPLLMAAASFATLPPLILFLLTQHWLRAAENDSSFRLSTGD